MLCEGDKNHHCQTWGTLNTVMAKSETLDGGEDFTGCLSCKSKHLSSFGLGRGEKENYGNLQEWNSLLAETK